MDEALAALDRDVLPGITHWNHPSFFAYFPSNTSYASILADIVQIPTKSPTYSDFTRPRFRF